MVIDVALAHEFSGDCFREVQGNGQLCYDDPDILLDNAARAKVQKYREAYSPLDRHMANLPAILSTSGRVNRQILRLLYILSHRIQVKSMCPSGACTPFLRPYPLSPPPRCHCTARRRHNKSVDGLKLER